MTPGSPSWPDNIKVVSHKLGLSPVQVDIVRELRCVVLLFVLTRLRQKVKDKVTEKEKRKKVFQLKHGTYYKSYLFNNKVNH